MNDKAIAKIKAQKDAFKKDLEDMYEMIENSKEKHDYIQEQIDYILKNPKGLDKETTEALRDAKIKLYKVYDVINLLNGVADNWNEDLKEAEEALKGY